MPETLEAKLTTVTQVFVHMADKEYGSDLMARAAQQVADDNVVAKNLLITVFEHGGWSLTYFVDGSEVLLVGSANDSAVFTGRKAEIRNILNSKNIKWEYLPEVWRK